MGSRTNRHPRCDACYLHVELCMCDVFRPMQTRTQLALIWHRDEERKTTNTGRLALRTLENSRAFIRGLKDAPVDLTPLDDPARRLFVLFPTSGAKVLTQELVHESDLPITLAVPDATWRQARAMVRREAILANATKVVPPPGRPSRYQLRRAPETDHLSTAEAIARSFGVIEGPEVQQEIERVFELMVERTLEMRQPTPKKSRFRERSED